MSNIKSKNSVIFRGSKDEKDLIEHLLTKEKDTKFSLGFKAYLSGDYLDKRVKYYYSVAVVNNEAFVIGGYSSSINKEQQETMHNTIWNSFTNKGYKRILKSKDKDKQLKKYVLKGITNSDNV